MSFYTPDISEGNNWKGLVRAVARMMSHIGWKDTAVIDGSGDMGADVLATRTEGNKVKSWVVQSKAVSGDRYIGPKAMQEAVNALSFYDAEIAAVATNGEFTQTAKARQKQLEANGYNLKLWNGSFIKNIVDQMPADSIARRGLRPYQDVIVNKVTCLST